MRSFVSCALLIVFFQLSISTPIIERSEVEAITEQSTEKLLHVVVPPPPAPLHPHPPPPPPPPVAHHPPRSLGLKDNIQSKKIYISIPQRSEVEASTEQSTEKLLHVVVPPPPAPLHPHPPPPPPPPVAHHPPRSLGMKYNIQNKKASIALLI
ncbi:hypothetical protein BY996DRAFT_4303285 [Phakopsora pachyrhizi]|nr:hypothetical protein BY996DRAFT_4303285 [Phakopsora pachyrhizi]